MDLVWLGRRPVLHVVYCHSCYGNAAFIENMTALRLWQLFIKIWFTVYCGYPDVLHIDSEPSFMVGPFRDAAECSRVVVQVSNIEGHYAIGVGERYHAPLQRVYNAARLEDPSLASEPALRLAIKAIKDTMGPNGVVPSLLV